MQAFNAPMLSRNPVLHYVFARMEMAEERGLGLKSMKARAQASGLPLPIYSLQEPYLVLTVYRSSESVARTADLQIMRSLNSAEKAGWAWLSMSESVSSSEYAEAMKVPNRTALNHLKRLKEVGLITKFGAGPSTRYRITPP